MSIAASEIIAAGKHLGIDPETILSLVAEIDARKVEARRVQATERQRRKRDLVTQNSVTCVTCVTNPPPPCSPPSPSPDPNPNPPYNPPQPLSSSSDVRALERECRQLVGGEPVALAQDFAALAVVLTEGMTPDDVIAGVRAAMAEPSFRPLAWRQMIGWARRAAKDRLAAAPKVVGLPPARGSPSQKPQRYTMFDAMREMMSEAESG